MAVIAAMGSADVHGSSAAAAARVIDLIAADEVTRSVTQVFGVIGRVAEVAATIKAELAASAIS